MINRAFLVGVFVAAAMFAGTLAGVTVPAGLSPARSTQ